MLIIRLQRIGKKHQPSYRLVVAERRSKLIAPPVEDLGSYNPSTKLATIHKDRVIYWIGMGAKPSLTAHNLLVKQGVLDTPKIQMNFKIKAVEGGAVAAVESKAEEVPAEETPKEEAPVEAATS